MFDVGLPELVVLVVAALFVFGPDRLPGIAAQAARTLRELRGMAAGVRREINDAVGPDLAELGSLTTLDPRRAVTRTLLEADAEADSSADGAAPQPRSPAPGPKTAPGPTTSSAAAAPDPSYPAFDPDAT